MNRAHALVGLLVLAAALAGCTGRFDVDQTDPIRVRIEGLDVDGEARQATIVANDGGGGTTVTGNTGAAASKEFRIQNTNNVEVVQVTVVATRAAATVAPPPAPPAAPPPSPPPGGNGTNTTDPNATQPNGTAPPPPGGSGPATTVIILVIVEDRDTGERIAEQTINLDQDRQTINLDVDVKGKDNVVVITQAQQGSADVSVTAKGVGGSAAMDGNATQNQTGP